MDEREQPRTWTLKHPSEAAIEVAVAVRGPVPEGGSIEVVELDPILDLLERIDSWCRDPNITEPKGTSAVTDDIISILVVHGRLKVDV